MDTNVLKDPIGRLRAYADNMDSLLIRIDKSDVLMGIADEIESGYMKLPVDADGVPIKPGDEMQFGTDAPVRVDSIGTSRCYCGDFGWFGSNGGFYGRGTLRSCRHVKRDTVESLLQELADEVWEASCTCQTTWSDSGLDGIAERYAERIRKAVHDGD